MANQLPAGFEALEPFVDRFALPGTAARAQRRADSADKERRAFHAAAAPLIGQALDMLDTQPVDALEGPEKRLLDLVLAFAHVALAVEVQGPEGLRHAAVRTYKRITHSPADAAA